MPRRHLLPLLLAALLTATATATAAEATFRIGGPDRVRVGQVVSFPVRGAAPGERLEVSVAPTLNRGGNCCGIGVRGARADDRGRATIRFRWPAYYRNGAERVRWAAGTKADVIVFAKSGRGLRVVRVR